MNIHDRILGIVLLTNRASLVLKRESCIKTIYVFSLRFYILSEC